MNSPMLSTSIVIMQPTSLILTEKRHQMLEISRCNLLAEAHETYYHDYMEKHCIYEKLEALKQ